MLEQNGVKYLYFKRETRDYSQHLLSLKGASPKLADIKEAFYDGTYLHVVIKHIDGSTIEQLINEAFAQNVNLSEDRIVKILKQMSEAIKVMHDKKYIIRGLNPSSFVVDSKDQVFLVDYCLSKQTVDDAA